MGNTSCTDAVPFTLDDILLSKHSSPDRRIEELLSADAIDRFARFEHNFKAFAFRRRSSPAKPSSSGTGIDMSQAYVLPLDISQAKISVDETAVYLVLHVQRIPTCGPSPRTVRTSRSSNSSRHADLPVADLDSGRQGFDESPSWAVVFSDAFTPRGLEKAFSTNIGKPSLTLSASSSAIGTTPGVDGFDFRYSIHLLCGVKANPIVAAVAVLHALKIERLLMGNEELLRRLFFNYNACRIGSDKKIEMVAYACIGEVVSGKKVNRAPRLSEEYMKNAFLRILYHLRSRPSLLPQPTAPSSGRGNISHTTTPRGRLSTPPAVNSLFFRQRQHVALSSMSTAGTAANIGTRAGAGDNRQSLPGVEIPRLRFSLERPQQNTMESSFVAGRRTDLPTPHASHRDGKSSRSNNASSLGTPRVPTMLPISPTTFNLRLGETLSKCGSSEVPIDVDEIRMTEERLLKLKAASPQATEILPWLFVGGEEAARDRAQLLEKGITAVINTIAFSMGNLHNNIFRYLGLYVNDSPDEPIFSLFPVVVRFVEESRKNGGKTFIHCHQGVSRSCSFVIAYVMWYQGVCFDQAYDFVRVRRNVCSPNAGFYVNLLLWENHMAAPELNKAYAYVPYAEYLFPFSYRMALVFRSSQKSLDGSDNSKIVSRYARTVYETSDDYVLDPRLSYGFLFEEHKTCKNEPHRLISSYFFADAACDAVMRHQAKEDWDAFIKYGFYHGPKKTTANNKGESITFMPLPSLAQPTETFTSIEDVEAAVNQAMLDSWKKGSSSSSHFPKPTLTHDSCWDGLLARGDIASCFSNHLAEEERTNMSSGNRKRIREEERRRVTKTTVIGGTPRFSPHTVAGENAAALATQSTRSPLSGTRHAALLSHRGTSSTPSIGSSLAVGLEPEIYLYPFSGSPIKNIIEVEDMETDRSYAVILPAAVSTSAQHHVFLWLGRNCGLDEADVREAYKHSLKVATGVRLWSGVALSSVVEEVVHEGDEPDELLFALD